MSESYLLECKCGTRTAVNPSQAGRTVRCACGAKVDVPALRSMRRLPIAEQADAEQQPAWNLRQRLWTIGAVLILLAIALGVYTQWIAPPPPDAAVKDVLDRRLEQFKRQVEDYSISKAKEEFRKIDVEQLHAFANEVATSPYYEIYREKSTVSSYWSIMAWSLAAAGLLLIASGHVLGAAPRHTQSGCV
jgi:hypothetical protein